MSQDAKTIVSTALEAETLQRLDDFCGTIHRTRAAVIRGLLYALLFEGKQFIFDEWRKEVTGE